MPAIISVQLPANAACCATASGTARKLGLGWLANQGQPAHNTQRCEIYLEAECCWHEGYRVELSFFEPVQRKTRQDGGPDRRADRAIGGAETEPSQPARQPGRSAR